MDDLTLPKLIGIVMILSLSTRGTTLDLYTVGTLVISDQQPQNFSQITNQCTPSSCEGRVWMYYDDPYIAGECGTIGAPNIRDYDKQVICRQLGYNMSVQVLEKKQNGNIDGPILFTDLSCDTRNKEPLVHNNILQCNYNICRTPSDCSHNDDIIVNCKNSILNSQRYHGEVYLCPPVQKPYGMQTVMGVVQLHLDNTESKSIAIKSVHDVAKNFPTYKADTLCRQMGFTHAVPNSVHVFLAASKLHQFNFNRSCITRSWFDVSQLNECNEKATPTPCFGCCYDYDYNPKCDDCSNETAMVLSCTYDIFKGQDIISGSKRLCELQRNDDKINDLASTCDRHSGLTARDISLLSAVAIESFLLLLVMSAVILYILRTKLKKLCLRHDYTEFKDYPVEDQQPNSQENLANEEGQQN